MLANLKRKQILFLSLFSFVSSSLIGSSQIANSQSKEWSYGGYTNPTKWDNISSDFQTCETGERQSPINIKEGNTYDKMNRQISLNYEVSDLEVVNNGHSIQVNYDAGSSLTVGNETYQLQQFHFHTPSEHQINGEASSMELHLVHTNDQGDIAVVGVLIQPGQMNSELQKVWSNLPKEGETKKLATTVDASEFLPNNQDFYHYSGSLTSPPCSQGVSWFIFQEPIEASKQQIDAFAELYPRNARPIQATNNRPIFDIEQ